METQNKNKLNKSDMEFIRIALNEYIVNNMDSYPYTVEEIRKVRNKLK